MIMLSRNCPVSLVVGVAGFLGSHLAEALLEKGIQVVGLDDLSSGKNEYLIEASKNKKFHFLHKSAKEELNFELPRLDYAYFIISENIDPAVFKTAWRNFLEFCLQFKPKVVLVSSVELYDTHGEGLLCLREAEEKLARFSLEEKLNARVVRLAAVYGPRMHFRSSDPMVRLINASAQEKLQREVVALDFITRSIYIDDAVNLLLKAVMHGGTVQKIYDGALLVPVKVVEVKQVLLDPLWHESRNFLPTELPPWPTPNLSKTMKELSWKPRTTLVEGLKVTMRYLKEHPMEEIEEISKKEEVKSWQEISEPKEVKKEVVEEVKKGSDIKIPKSLIKKVRWYSEIALILSLFIYTVLYPLGTIAWEGREIPNELMLAGQALGEGNMDRAKLKVNDAQNGVKKLDDISRLATLTGGVSFLKNPFSEWVASVEIYRELVLGMDEGVRGTQVLGKGWEIISGEKTGDMDINLEEALSLFSQSQKRMTLMGENLNQGHLLRPAVVSAQKQINFLWGLTNLLSQALSLEEKRSYLVLLLDNTNLRPGGGVVVSFAEVTFEKGKLLEIKSGSIADLDDSFKGNLEPPSDIKNDLGVSNWRLRDAAFESDWPSGGRFTSWLYQKESDKEVAGLVWLDLTTLSSLLGILGAVDLPSGEVNSANLWSKATSKDQRTVLTAVLKEIVNRLFFLPQKDWAKLSQLVIEYSSQKHMGFYFTDPALETLVETKGWSRRFPTVKEEQMGQWYDFLAFTETNIADSSGNYFLQRGLNLQTTLGQSGEVSHKLTLNYFNQQGAGESNNYQSRLRVVLPQGSKITEASLGGESLLLKMGSFSDNGRAGYIFPILIKPQEQKSLILQYESLNRAVFKEGKLNYSIDIIKQPGTDKDKFELKLNLPEGFRLSSGNNLFEGNLAEDQHIIWAIEK